MASSGFTLPELLVVMAIIGTLSSIGVVSYSSARAAARDVKRVSDMKQIQTSLELFFENNSRYPLDGIPGSEGTIIGLPKTRTLSDAGFSADMRGTPYMITVPKNPEPFGSPYVYRSLNADGSDCDTGECASYAILFTTEKTQGNYLAGPHAMTPAGLAGAEGGYAGEGVVEAGEKIVGIEAVQAQLDIIAGRATDETLKFIDDERVETIAERAVAPTVAAAAVANTALTTTSAASYLLMFLTQPFALVGRRRRQAWGTVYNALSRLPADLVIVRLRDAATNRIVKSTVTDIKGRYSFLAPRGAYRIEASKVGYSFPSQVTQGKKEDGPFVDLYHGEVIDVGAEGAILTPNIPLDPAVGDVADAAVLKKDFWKRFNHGVAVLSPTLGGMMLLIKPSAFVGLLFVAQIVTYLLFRRIAEPSQPKNWGIVYEQGTQKPVPQAILRIFEAKYNKLLETQVTDRSGRYHFRVGSNVYYLTVTKPGYNKTQTDPLDLSSVTEATVIASDLPLQPAAKGGAAAAGAAEEKRPSAIPPAQPGYAAGATPQAAAAGPVGAAGTAAAIPQATAPVAAPPIAAPVPAQEPPAPTPAASAAPTTPSVPAPSEPKPPEPSVPAQEPPRDAPKPPPPAWFRDT